jgi:hypothetical protein
MTHGLLGMHIDAWRDVAWEVDGQHHVLSQQQVGTLMSSETERFIIFGDSLSGEIFFTGEAEGIS